jgi:hypothetical protein
MVAINSPAVHFEVNLEENLEAYLEVQLEVHLRSILGVFEMTDMNAMEQV